MRVSRISSFKHGVLPVSSLALLLGAPGCEAPAEPDAAAPGTCDGSGPTKVGIIQQMVWGRIDADSGVSPGFDLDGRVSNANDRLGCKIQDFVSPEGEEGVDNGFGRLLPTLELTEFMAVEALIGQSISTGGLLITLELRGVDDLVNDDCVELTVGRGEGDVLLGTDGLLESGQTIRFSDDLPSFTMHDLAIVDGRLIAQPFEVTLPLTVFDTSLELQLTQAAIELNFNEDGTISGVIGGGTPTAYILNVVSTEAVDAGLEAMMGSLLGLYADLTPGEDGVCQDISVNFEYEAIPGFLFEH